MDNFFYIVGIWLLCGIAAAAIYDRKGRSAVSAFIVGITLGPVGVLLALLSGPDQVALENKQLKSGEMKRCPFCDELVRRDATVCRFCGRDI